MTAALDLRRALTLYDGIRSYAERATTREERRALLGEARRRPWPVRSMLVSALRDVRRERAGGAA